jgi:crotonobetainyl-CoA:carnitine CoA-transferase CaiB-like acyl-CoA transferase
LQTLNDPQVKATGLLDWIDYPGLAKLAPVVKGPVEFSALDTEFRRRPPTLGEHTVEILKSVGYDDAGIVALKALRVV